MKKKSIRKIIFIEPRAPGIHFFSRWRQPRLGTVILGTILKRSGYDVKVFVEDMKNIDFKAVFAADAVGISTITATATRAYAIAQSIREAGIPVFMGGSHVTFMADEALGYADYVLRGEAEDTILAFIRALEAQEGFEKIGGLSYRDGSRVVHNHAAPHYIDMDRLPFPDFSVVDGYRQSETLLGLSPLMTSRGCPFACNFCSVTAMFGHRYRFRSIDNVIGEIRALNPKRIFFYDDNFTANKAHTKKLLKEMIRQGITKPWAASVRIDVAEDEELLELMRQSQCYTLYIGLESVNPETLKSFNKSQTLEEMKRSIRTIHRHKIRIHGMFIFGADNDDISTIRETVKFSKKMKIEMFNSLMLMPLPGTPILKKMEDEKRLISHDWSYYDGCHVVFKPERMTFLDLQEETIRALKSFYSPIRAFSGCNNKFDLSTAFLRIQGNCLLRRWKDSNREFMKHLKHLDQLTSSGSCDKKLELPPLNTAVEGIKF